MNLPKIVSDYWHTGLIFYRPDPLGYYVIQQDMYRVMKYMKMPLDEKQRYKGRKIRND
jgi:hypothetical protein